MIENVSYELGIFSYFLSIPGLYFAVVCFVTDPGIVKRGNLQEPDSEIEEKTSDPLP